jgi:membrane fusion protein (multidrug efflux system)
MVLFTAKNRVLSWMFLAPMAMLASSCARHGTPPVSKPTVTVVQLRTQPVLLTTELPGRVSAFRIAEVRPQVSGVLLKRLFKEGGVVAAGQQLYQIDPAPYEAALAGTRATLAHARAAVRAAKLTVERYSDLVRARAVSREDFDNAVAALQEDEADATSGEAAVRAAEIELAYTKVYSPIRGRTGRSSVTEGALVIANQATSLVSITQLDPVYVDLTQPSATLIRLERELAAGQIRRADATEAAARLLLEDGSVYESLGRLEFSEATVDQGTDSVTLRAIFSNRNGLLLPGMFVRALIEEGVREGTILVPQEGITHAPDGSATALVVTSNDKVEVRTVELGRAVGHQWLVTHGLAAGDRLIVAGMQEIRPGMRVTVRVQVAGGAPASAEAALAAR